MNSRTSLGGAAASGTACDILVEDCGVLEAVDDFVLDWVDIVGFVNSWIGREKEREREWVEVDTWKAKDVI
jgi:hypothetical protein